MHALHAWVGLSAAWNLLCRMLRQEDAFRALRDVFHGTGGSRAWSRVLSMQRV